jgi:hypothetical protein
MAGERGQAPWSVLPGSSRGSDLVDLQDFIRVIVDYVQSDLAGSGRLEGIALRAVEISPLGFVDPGS